MQEAWTSFLSNILLTEATYFFSPKSQNKILKQLQHYACQLQIWVHMDMKVNEELIRWSWNKLLLKASWCEHEIQF